MNKVLAWLIVGVFYSLIIGYSFFAIPAVFERNNVKGILLTLLVGTALLIWTKISAKLIAPNKKT